MLLDRLVKKHIQDYLQSLLRRPLICKPDKIVKILLEDNILKSKLTKKEIEKYSKM